MQLAPERPVTDLCPPSCTVLAWGAAAVPVADDRGSALDVWRAHYHLPSSAIAMSDPTTLADPHPAPVRAALHAALAGPRRRPALIYVHHGETLHYRIPLMQQLLDGLPAPAVCHALRAPCRRHLPQIATDLGDLLSRRHGSALLVWDRLARLVADPPAEAGDVRLLRFAPPEPPPLCPKPKDRCHDPDPDQRPAFCPAPADR